MTQNLFFKQIMSSISSGERKAVKLSKDQQVIALAAYGIYAREIATKKEDLNQTISDLRVEVQEGKIELVKEQAKTSIALLLNKESVKQFGRFLVEPIANWGADSKNTKLIEFDPNASVETSDEYLVAPPEQDEVILKKDVPNDNIVVTNRESKDNRRPVKGELDSSQTATEMVSDLPWYIRTPTVMMSHIFGKMSPLVAVILIVSVVSGAIYYGR